MPEKRFVRLNISVALFTEGVTEETDEEIREKMKNWGEQVEKQTTMKVKKMDIDISRMPMPKETDEMLKHVEKEGYGR